MAQKIIIKKSTVAAKAPTDAQLDVGELAVNTADSLLYTKHSDGSIKRLSPTMAERSKIADSVSSSDARLTNSREWSEATVTQAEAEAGTASTRRAWTSQRVRQAINAWWQLVTSGFGRNFIVATNERAARNVLQLGTAATRDVGTASGDLMEVGAYGLGASKKLPNMTPETGIYFLNRRVDGYTPPSWIPNNSYTSYIAIKGRAHNLSHGLVFDVDRRTVFLTSDLLSSDDGIFSDPRELIHTGNILPTTGQSTEYPMTQKAVTDAINARGFADASGVLTATSGALSNDMSSFLSQATKATMRSNLGVPQLNASATAQGGLKARLAGTTLYLSNDGTNP